MYVVDESDAKVYTYNMPNAIDARLSSLTLSGVDIGEFDRSHEEYEGTPDEGVTVTTVEAEALQRRTSVDIDPPDADGAAEGHQVALEDLTEITVTVTSADGSRTKTYRVRLGPEEAADPAPEEVAESAQEEVDEPVASCLRGDIAAGFSLVLYGGGGVEDLVACAEGRNVTALYVLDGGEYVSYIVGAPGFVNGDFRALFTDGVPALTPLVARSDGPPSPDPAGDAPRTADATQPWPECLRGDVAEGFSLVVYEGGSGRRPRDLCAGPRRDRDVHAARGCVRLLHPRRTRVGQPGLRRAVRRGRPVRHPARRQGRRALNSRQRVALALAHGLVAGVRERVEGAVPEDRVITAVSQPGVGRTSSAARNREPRAPLGYAMETERAHHPAV